MNPVRLYRLSLWATIGICLISVAFQWVNVTIQPGLWYLAVAPTIFIPNIVSAAVIRKARKKSARWPVATIVTRPIAAGEKQALERRGFWVDNMYVHALVRATGPSDALTILEQNVRACLKPPVEFEEMVVNSPGTARRMTTLAGKADDVVNQLLEMNHRGHSEGERP